MPDSLSTGAWMPLTLPQLDFWEEFTFHPDQPVSTVAHFIELTGNVDEAALIRAIEQTIREAEVLSARFRQDAGSDQPKQSCDPEFLPELVREDLRSADDPVARARAAMEADLASQLDLRSDRLSAQALYRVGDDRYLWYIRAHHIIIDGYGLALIEQRCAQLYNHFLGHGDEGPAFHSLADFLEEEERYRKSGLWARDREFWNSYFAGTRGIEVLERGDEDYGEAGLFTSFPLPPDFGDRLRSMAGAADLGWPDLLTLLCALYLVADEGGDDGRLTLWLPFMSRWGSVGAHLPALLVNILPFQVTVDPGETLEAFLKRSAADLRQQRKHSRFRIEQISKDQALAAGSRYFFSPLINVLPFNAPVFDGCDTRRNILDSGPADGFNLTFRGEEDGSRLTLAIDADPALTSTEDFERHEAEVPAFLMKALSPDLLRRPVGEIIAPVPKAAAFELAALGFPL